MIIIKYFFSGILLFNAIPHLFQGICGNYHMTPFSIKSRPITNVLWGWLNLFSGYLLLPGFDGFGGGDLTLYAFATGGFIISVWLSVFWSNPNARLPWHRNHKE